MVARRHNFKQGWIVLLLLLAVQAFLPALATAFACPCGRRTAARLLSHPAPLSSTSTAAVSSSMKPVFLTTACLPRCPKRARVPALPRRPRAILVPHQGTVNLSERPAHPVLPSTPSQINLVTAASSHYSSRQAISTSVLSPASHRLRAPPTV